jgi:hypothetical protein
MTEYENVIVSRSSSSDGGRRGGPSVSGSVTVATAGSEEALQALLTVHENIKQKPYFA